MRVEVREVTVVKSVFVADDGTEFHDSTDCKKYEIKQLEKVVELYTDDFKRTDFNRATFVNLKDATDIANFKKLADYCDMEDKGVDGAPGVYMWMNSWWVNLSNLVDAIKNVSKEKNNV